MSSSRFLGAIATSAVAAALLAASPASAAHDLDAVAVTPSNELVSFATGAPNEPTAVAPVTGLLPGEEIVGIDVRPRTGVLYALTGASRLYAVDTDTAAATFASTLSVPLSGSAFGVDFNPAADRLRITSDANQNLRVNVDTGASADGGTVIGDGTDDPLAYGTGGADPAVVGSAYTNNDADQFATPVPAAPTGTTLYDIDTAFDTLVVQSPPNNGTLTTVGLLGREAREDVGFDIYSELSGGQAVSNVAFASFGKGGTEKLYRVDLSKGQVKQVGPFGSYSIRDIAILTAG